MVPLKMAATHDSGALPRCHAADLPATHPAPSCFTHSAAGNRASEFRNACGCRTPARNACSREPAAPQEGGATSAHRLPAMPMARAPSIIWLVAPLTGLPKPQDTVAGTHRAEAHQSDENARDPEGI